MSRGEKPIVDRNYAMKHENVRVVVGQGTSGKEWRLFRNPEEILTADEPEDVLSTLYAVEKAVDEGFHAAGFLAYEAASGLDKACQTHTLRSLPLVWFGLFRCAEDIQNWNVEAFPCGVPPVFDPSACRLGSKADRRAHAPDVRDADLIPPARPKPLRRGEGPRRPLRLTDFKVGEWEPSILAEEYRKVIGRIKRYLKSGDTYQVNYTLRLRAQFEGDPWSLFLCLHRTQRAKYSVFIDTDDFTVCSASPELFFSLDGEKLVSRPMKGTSARGLTFEQDKELADVLWRSEKNRAENVMIVDMVRNDMGRIADPGSVWVPHLFEIERYPTVFQMTSTVACTTSASFADIVKALFPCASITGAPKIRTMQIIKELEQEPRGIYTGCIGCLSPGRRAEFNVAIRTVSLDKDHGTAEYGVGGGIVWDSDARNEYEECRIKSKVLMTEVPNFELLESILWEGNKGYFLLDRHLERLRRSAEYFGFVIDLPEIRERLMQEVDIMGGQSYKVRLRLTEEGEITIERKLLSDLASTRPWSVTFVEEPIDSGNRFLYHKTTNRAVYNRTRLSAGGCDDVLLWNEGGKITESTVANIVIKKDGKYVTPPVKCGLLAGVFREWLLKRGEIEEGVITREDVENADKVFLINSVRKWIPVILEDANEIVGA